MLYNCRESIDIDAEPDITLLSFTIHELPYKNICMTTMIAVITHDLSSDMFYSKDMNQCLRNSL